MSDFHLKHIRSALLREFAPHIDSTDLASVPVEHQQDNLLSRSLAAYALCLCTDVSPEVAGSHVTDGASDHGIDAFYFDAIEHRVYVVQSKWSHKSDRGLKAADVRTFTDGLRELLDGDFTTFNDRFKRLEDELNSAIADVGATFTLVLAHTGARPLSRDVGEHVARFLAELNDAKETFQVRIYSQAELHDGVAKRAEGTPVGLQEVLLHEWSCIREPYVAYQGQVAASDIAQWHQQHQEKLFRKNLRQVIPGSDVNVAMAETLRSAPQHFWYFDNGITIICDSIKARAKGSGSRAPKSLCCSGVNIVNGAQTVGAIALAHGRNPESVRDAWVSVRLISLEDCPAGFAEAITRATNTQNSITNRDFAALDEQQRRLRREMQLDGKEYVFRTGEVDVPPPRDRGCTIDEATVALACEQEVALAVIAKSTIGRIWEDTTRPPYTLLFNASVSAQHVWKAVEVLRAVDECILREQNARAGRQKQTAIHGNRFITHQVFKRLHAFHGDSFDGVPRADIERQVAALTVEALDATIRALDARFRGAYLQMFFKSRENCRLLDQALEQHEQTAVPPVGANYLLWSPGPAGGRASRARG